jgi:hypothetical protein
MGADSLRGAIGGAIYVVGNTGDQVAELEGEGTNTIDARATDTLSANVENLCMVGTAGIGGKYKAGAGRSRRLCSECANEEWRTAA